MRRIREVLRLKAEGYSDRQIAASIGSARSTVQECIRRAREAGFCWPLPTEIDESALHAQLYRRAVPLSRTPQPDFAELHRELGRRGVTRLLLWEEYKSAHPDGWQYSVFCDQYRRWRARQELVLRQACARLRTIPGVGLIAATAIVGAVGNIGRFRNGRCFASWLGLTPREHSSGHIRRLGSITKRGDKYLRTLLVHGSRAVIMSANAAQRKGQLLGAFRQWASEIRARCGHN